MMLEEKLNKCKNKKECLSIIKDYFSQYVGKVPENEQGLIYRLFSSMLLATSHLLDKELDKKDYKKLVDHALKEYKNEISKRTRKIESKVNEMVEEIIRLYPRLEKLEGESGFIEELVKDIEKREKPEYLA